MVNLGNNSTVSLQELVQQLEDVLGVEAKLQRLPEQPGDVPQTWADIGKAEQLFGYRPTTTLVEGLEQFSSWLRRSARLSQQVITDGTFVLSHF